MTHEVPLPRWALSSAARITCGRRAGGRGGGGSMLAGLWSVKNGQLALWRSSRRQSGAAAKPHTLRQTPFTLRLPPRIAPLPHPLAPAPRAHTLRLQCSVAPQLNSPPMQYDAPAHSSRLHATCAARDSPPPRAHCRCSHTCSRRPTWSWRPTPPAQDGRSDGPLTQASVGRPFEGNVRGFSPRAPTLEWVNREEELDRSG
jgi:hypothetical protein